MQRSTQAFIYIFYEKLFKSLKNTLSHRISNKLEIDHFDHFGSFSVKVAILNGNISPKIGLSDFYEKPFLRKCLKIEIRHTWFWLLNKNINKKKRMRMSINNRIKIYSAYIIAVI